MFITPNQYPNLINAFRVLGVELNNKKLLDIAAYDGEWTKALESGGAQVIAVDPALSRKMKERVANQTGFDSRGEDFLSAHPEHNAQFDVVTNLNMSGRAYWESHMAMMPMIVTALKDTGKFVMSYEGFPGATQMMALKEYFKDVEFHEVIKREGGIARPDLDAFCTVTVITCKGPTKNIERERIALNRQKISPAEIIKPGNTEIQL